MIAYVDSAAGSGDAVLWIGDGDAEGQTVTCATSKSEARGRQSPPHPSRQHLCAFIFVFAWPFLRQNGRKRRPRTLQGNGKVRQTGSGTCAMGRSADAPCIVPTIRA